MPDNQAIIQVLYQTQGVDSIKLATTALTQSDDAAKKVSTSTKDMGDSIGMTRREFTRTGTEAAYALSAIGGKAGEAHAELAPLITGAQQLGSAFIYGSAVTAGVVGIALAIGAISSAIDTNTPQQTAFRKEIDGVLDSATDAAKGLAQMSAATDDDATNALKAAKANHDYAVALKEASTTQITQKNALQQVGDTLGLTFKGLNAVYQVGSSYNEQLKQGKSAEDARRIALEAGQVAMNGMTDAERANLKAVIDNSAAVLEQQRVIDLMKTNLPAMSKEIDSYTASMEKLTDSHQKQVATFTQDTLKAEATANTEQLASQQSTADSIAKIYGNLSTRLGDMAVDAAGRQAQAEHDWLRQAQGFANDRANIEQTLADKIQGITESEADQESNAKTYAEVLTLRKKEQQNIDAANKQAAKSRSDLTDRQQDALNEFDYKENLANQESIKTAQRAQRDADIQAEEQRRAEREKEIAIAARLVTEKAAIQDRANTEAASYKQSQADATKAHTQKMKELTDERTEVQRLTADYWNTYNALDANTRKLIEMSGILGNLPFQQVGGAAGQWDWARLTQLTGRQAGGSFTVPGNGSGDRPYILPLEPGERVSVTPKNQTTAGPTIHIYIGTREITDIITEQINQNDRGL